MSTSRLKQAFDGSGSPFGRRFPLALAALALASLIWLPSLHLFFQPGEDFLSRGPISPKARALAARHLALWTDSSSRAAEIRRMRDSNAEWDFMGRTYLVLALTSMALREPERQDLYLRIADQIIDETRKVEAEKSFYFFLMDYARARPFVEKPARSLFVDGEIALMLGARRLVAEKESYRAPLADLVTAMAERMRNGPVLCAESYPDECWMFCNTLALSAIRISDVLDGGDHSKLLSDWVEMARRRLVDPGTGLLVSSFSLDGTVGDGPEGSTIWMAAHCLQLVDEEFAADQYRRARKELGKVFLGFGFAREWPASFVGPRDIDSGPIIPFVEASPSSSGLAFIAASAFGDPRFFSHLSTSLNLAAFPVESDGSLRYCASNQVGDAAMLYAMVLGPLWQKVKERTAR